MISLHGYSQRWKKERLMAGYGIGVANFLGELGGRDEIGSNFTRDLEFAATRPGTYMVLRYRLTQKLAIKGAFTLGFVSGADSLTEEYHRNYRNFHFRSPIMELSTQFEYSIIKDRDARRYRLRSSKGGRIPNFNLYIFAGFGGFYFNPQAYYNGRWENLQPLGTEGQKLGDILPTRKPYSRFSVCIPFGFGMRLPTDRLWSIGLEYGARKTFTDYLDDVSLTYIDNNTIKVKNGELAAALADRSVAPNPNYTQRGDPSDKDWYMFMCLSVHYKIKMGRRSLPSF